MHYLSISLGNTDLQLSEAEELILREMQEDTNAFDLQPPRVKIAPGGIGQFLLGDETAKSFVAVVALSQKVRGYWPEAGVGTAPLCSSPDGVTGYFNIHADETQNSAGIQASRPHPALVQMLEGNQPNVEWECALCPMNQWGSEHQRGEGRGKACKEMRRLLLLIDGWTIPALMSLPPTSIRSWDSYCSALAAKRSAYFVVRTKFELDTAKAAGGETYNVVKVSLAGSIEDMDQLRTVAEIRRQYREMVRGMPVEAADYDTTDDTPF